MKSGHGLALSVWFEVFPKTTRIVGFYMKASLQGEAMEPSWRQEHVVGGVEPDVLEK